MPINLSPESIHQEARITKLQGGPTSYLSGEEKWSSCGGNDYSSHRSTITDVATPPPPHREAPP